MLRLLAFVLLLSAAPAAAQETRTLAPGAKSPPASIDQLAWLAGTWRGEGMGAPITESYTAPQAGGMAGHFVMEDGKGGVRFYELLQITTVGDTLLYRLRHFNPDLTGWEDKTGKAEEFPLVAIEPDAVHFAGLTFRRTAPDALTIWVSIGQHDGTARDVPFHYRRAAP